MARRTTGSERTQRMAAPPHDRASIHSRWRLRAGQAGVRFPAAKSVRASDNEAMAMTEQEWLACSDPQPMLEFMRGRASERKLRLLACAFCRGLWDRLGDSERHLVEVAERFIEHQASEEDLAAAREEVVNALPLAPRARAHVWAAAQASAAVRSFSGIARLVAEVGNTLRAHWNQPADSDVIRMTSAVAFLPFHV